VRDLEWLAYREQSERSSPFRKIFTHISGGRLVPAYFVTKTRLPSMWDSTPKGLSPKTFAGFPENGVRATVWAEASPRFTGARCESSHFPDRLCIRPARQPST
jgi:hypothetical protein